MLYKGKDILKMSPSELRKVRGGEIGMIFQEPMTSLNPVLKIREQIYENLKDRGMSAREKHDRAIELLRLVGIPIPETRLNEYIHQYSGGMRQRAMIAIALAANPKLLLADEPTTALDVTIQDQIIKLLGRLKAQLGLSVILITHDPGRRGADVRQRGGHVCRAHRRKDRHPYAAHKAAPPLHLRADPVHPHGSSGRAAAGVHRRLTARPQPHAGGACPFAPRCRFKDETCLRAVPEAREIGPGHTVACHHSEKLEGIMGLPSSEGSA